MWALRKLRNLMMSHFGPNINVKSLLASPTGEVADADSKAYTVSARLSTSTLLYCITWLMKDNADNADLPNFDVLVFDFDSNCCCQIRKMCTF
jgi:hypothetical protein